MKSVGVLWKVASLIADCYHNTIVACVDYLFVFVFYFTVLLSWFLLQSKSFALTLHLDVHYILYWIPLSLSVVWMSKLSSIYYVRRCEVHSMWVSCVFFSWMFWHPCSPHLANATTCWQDMHMAQNLKLFLNLLNLVCFVFLIQSFLWLCIECVLRFIGAWLNLHVLSMCTYMCN